MSDEKDEPARSQRQPAEPPPPVLAAVLGMDLHDSEEAERAHEDAFKAFTKLLRKQVELFSSRIGIDEGVGDSIRQAFTDVRQALHCAFHLRRAAQQPIQDLDEVYVLEPRVVLHFDKFTKDEYGRIEGIGQILVARLDPIVPPGEIWATDAFVDVAQHLGADKGVAFEYMGQRQLAKPKSGSHPCYAVIPTTRGSSSRALQRPYDPVDLAMRKFDRGDQPSQAGAVEALGTIESESASHKLVNIALKPQVDRRVRHDALVLLQERGNDISDAETKKISEATENEQFDVETRALFLLVLGETGREGVFDTLSDVIEKRPPRQTRLREAALLAMRNLKLPDVADLVLKALQENEEHAVRIAACVAATSDRMSDEVQAKLRKIVWSTESPVKDPESPPKEEPLDLRRVACEALSSQPATGSLREKLKQLVQEPDLSLTLRRYAMDGLARFDDPTAMRVVEEIARRMDDELQVDAMVALAEMRAPRRSVHRRVQEPASYLAEVIRLRTRPPGRPA